MLPIAGEAVPLTSGHTAGSPIHAKTNERTREHEKRVMDVCSALVTDLKAANRHRAGDSASRGAAFPTRPHSANRVTASSTSSHFRIPAPAGASARECPGVERRESRLEQRERGFGVCHLAASVARVGEVVRRSPTASRVQVVLPCPPVPAWAGSVTRSNPTVAHLGHGGVPASG